MSWQGMKVLYAKVLIKSHELIYGLVTELSYTRIFFDTLLLYWFQLLWSEKECQVNPDTLKMYIDEIDLDGLLLF